MTGKSALVGRRPLVVEQVGEEPDQVEQRQGDTRGQRSDENRQRHEAQDGQS